MLDVDSLKADVGDPAVGPDLRGEVEFGEIEEAPRSFGGLSAGEFKKLIVKCGDLFARSKDQAAAIVALEAAARLGDLAEMRAALALIEHLVADHWENYHPGPVDEMGEARINELAALKRRAALLLPLTKLPIARLPGPGDVSFTIGMVKTASVPVAAWSKDDETRLKEMVDKGSTTRIDADLQKAQHERGRMLRGIARAVSPTARVVDSDANISFEDLASIADAETVAGEIIAQVAAKAAPLTDLGDALLGIDEAFEAKLGSNPGLGEIGREFYAMAKACATFVTAFSEPDVVAETPSDDPAPVVAGGSLAVSAPRPAVLGIDSVRNRADVVTALDAIIRYYGESEPASPVPVMV